ncbi:hypothetical protein [Methanobacterium oryzae]|uniref:hypothetical protein n=1 Tax=Methanobacterium oryzae TaxID=69540 RepID=UPI003D25ABC6
MNDKVNCWDIISKLRYDKSYWHHLEPAEIMEIVQRIKEGKKKIYGLDKWFKIDLRPALRKLNRMRSHIHVFHVHNFNLQKIGSYG